MTAETTLIRLEKYEEPLNSEGQLDADTVVTTEFEVAREAPTALDILREDERFTGVVNALDYTEWFDGRINRLHEEVLPDTEAALNNYQKSMEDVDARVRGSHVKNESRIGTARDRAEGGMVAPVRTMNMVVNDFKRKCDKLQQSSDSERAKFSDDLENFQVEMKQVRAEYSELVKQGRLIKANLETEKSFIATSLDRLVIARHMLAETTNKYQLKTDEYNEINAELAKLRRTTDAYGSLVTPQEDAENRIAVLKNSRAPLSGIRTVLNEEAERYADDRNTLMLDIKVRGKHVVELKEEDDEIREKLKDLVAKAESIDVRAHERGRAAIESLTSIKVEDAPNIVDNQLVTGAIVVNNPEESLRVLRRGFSGEVGRAAAESKYSINGLINALTDKEPTEGTVQGHNEVLAYLIKNVVAVAPSEQLSSAIVSTDHLHGDVLSQIVNSPETRPFDTFILQDILTQNGIPMPEGDDVMQLFRDFCASRQNAARDQRPTSLRGGQLQIRGQRD